MKRKLRPICESCAGICNKYAQDLMRKRCAEACRRCADHCRMVAA
jgi:hypothetical protein